MTSVAIQSLPVVLTTEEVAAILRCPTGTVDGYVYRRKLRAIRIGRERRFRADDVLEFVAARPVTNPCRATSSSR